MEKLTANQIIKEFNCKYFQFRQQNTRTNIFRSITFYLILQFVNVFDPINLNLILTRLQQATATIFKYIWMVCLRIYQL